ncbi:dolichyl-phosphate-mannose--protein mannosyltransferase [Jatrophihabitans endophyticus]|uniref:dolichyl-phosphate-mannose--protein mannosyltransferase n=1 Tax=Jatrophihabitans endophyticus TaxID=1206085 RepID=UPI0019DA4D45|nr:phospholipid carrier-dependent glycosyltransferase [Jatrophihabitans endophyticus]MBE7188419.1 phospholipid carrier-dependent glycosyltransferase [Jatrophihabitans endophyticus]
MTATIEATKSPTVEPPPDPPVTRRAVPAALVPWDDPHPRLGWLVTAVVFVAAALTRFWALGSPPGRNVVPQHGMNFDEIYYATEAQELLRFGYEDNRGYMFIVHPPLGKWLIAFSEYLWDGNSSQYLTNSLGWRIAPAVFGVLGVVMVSRIVRRMMRSELFGAIAGALMVMEGLSLVLARTAILDIFLQTFIIASFGALVIDREKMRARLAGLLADGADLTSGAPTLGPRPWRLVAGVMMGLAGAIKWTALSFFILFWIMSIVWDRAALKSAGVRRPARSWLRRSVAPSLMALLVLPVFAYLLCWTGWFTGENSWNRHWADTHSPSTHLSLLGVKVPFTWAWVPGPLRSLGAYHHDAYTFHEGLDSPHPYQSSPWSWWVLGRPVPFYYSGSDKTCGSSLCSREVLLIGTPLMWWAFVPVVLWLAWHWFTTRDWRAGVVWFVLVAGWLVWFQDLSRTMFLFYFAPIVPFLIMATTLAMGTVLGPPVHASDDPDRLERARRRRVWGAAGICTYLGIVVADFVWMWPIFTGGLMTYAQYHAHMWLPSWV